MWMADTSAWIDFLNGRPTTGAVLLRDSLRVRPGFVADLVVSEVLRGLRTDDRAAAVLRTMRQMQVVTVGGEEVAIEAARLYRDLRGRGITVRSLIDCLIAAYCILNDVELLHSDQDFDPFEEHHGLKVVRTL